MLQRWFAFGLCMAMAQYSATQYAAAQEGFQLAPGEKLLAVNGVPVNSQPTSQPTLSGSGVQQASYLQPGTTFSGSPVNSMPQASGGYQSQPMSGYSSSSSRGGNSPVIGEGTAAYQHALREAQIIAARGSNYHRSGDGGHPLGVAPGCSYAGTGYTWDPNRPGHCYLGELPDSRIVARARVQGANGAWFWSAHYR